MMVGQAGMMIFSLLIWRGRNVITYGIGYFFMGGYRLCRAMTVALVQPIIQAREMGLAFGMVESLNALAFMAAPLIAGVLYDWQPSSIFSVGLIVLGLSMILSIYLILRNRKLSGEGNEKLYLELDDES